MHVRLSGHDGATRHPRAGDCSVELRAFSGVPILRKSLFWDGNGEDDQSGVRARHFWHVTDRLALGAGLAGSTFFLGGANAYAAEAEAVGKYYLYRHDDFRAFADVTGGYMQSTDPVPEGGTEWNFSFSFGLGTEIPVAEDWDVLVGAVYHHISNALGRANDRNPSQNEAQFSLGVVFHY